LNVSEAPAPGQVDFPAGAVALSAGRVVDRLGLLAAIVGRLEARYPDLAADELPKAWAARLAWLGELVVAHTAQGELSGLAEGVDAEGALLIRLAGGETRRVVAGDVRLRPADGHRL
jgi:BirA family biotin operon repressor/biotin-[acetyl-CoA-carboxylase] ligase